MFDTKLKKNIFFNAITQMIVVLVPLITVPYVSRKLDPELIGNYNYCYAIVSIFALFANVGISTTGVSFVGKVKNDKKELSVVFYEMMIIRLIFMVLTMSSYIIFFFLTKEYEQYFLIMSLFIVATFLDVTWFFQGLENFKLVFIRTILIRLISLVSIFAFVRSQADIYIYIWINVLSVLIPNILLLPNLISKIEKVPLKELNLKRKLVVVLQFFLPGLAYTLYSIVDKTMIKFITGGTIEVGYYEQAYKIAFVGVTLMSVFSTVFSSRISSLNDDEEIKTLHTHAFSIVLFFSSIILVGLLFLADYFVPLYYGDGYEGSIAILKLFSTLPLIMGISNFVSYLYFIPKLITKPSIYIITIAIFLNIGLNFIFINLWGGFGAALATVISETFISFSYLVFYNKYFNIFKLLGNVWKFILSFIITFVITFVSSIFIKCDNLLIFFLYTIGISLMYLICLIILREQRVMKIFNKIVCMLRKERKHD